MKIDALRWLLLLLAVIASAAVLVRGISLGRAGTFVVCGAGWYVLSRRKVLSLDRDKTD